MKPIIAISMGDAAGIGPEITVKALAYKQVPATARCVVVGDKDVLEIARDFSGVELDIVAIKDPAEGNYEAGILNVIDQKNIDLKHLKMGQVQAMTGRAAYEAVEAATALCLNGQADVLTTTTMNKESLRVAQVPYIGHTEMVAAFTGATMPMTMFQVRGLRVFFLSRHLPLRAACDFVTLENLLPFIRHAAAGLKVLGIDEPRLAIAGLNPHSGEHGLFGKEEGEAIVPAVTLARAEGYDVTGPIAADSVFHLALEGKYDAVISLYHDQGHIAAKMVDFHRTISLTLGLPILRTSVDHGTALDIAGKGIASPVSLIEAIRVGAEYAPRFRREV